MNQKKIGIFIESKRKEKKLTRENLANKLNVTTRTIINWETGKCLPDYSILIPLSNILNITLDELINGEDKSKDTIELILDYLDRNRKINLQQKQILGKILLIGSITVILFIIFFIPRNATMFDTNIYIYISIILSILGYTLINNKYNFKKRFLLNIILIIIIIIFLTTQDTLNIIINNKPPRFYTSGLHEGTCTMYQTIFYNVYNCIKKDNKYHIVIKEEKVDFNKDSYMSPAYYYCGELE